MEDNKKSPQVAGTTSEGKQIRGITIEVRTEFEERLGERVSKFHSILENQAEELLKEIKTNSSTYGEIKEQLFKCEQFARWSSPDNAYLKVINEAKSQLEEEIDATTPK